MSHQQYIESYLTPDTAIIDEICPAGEPWSKVIQHGQIFRIVDLEGNQAVDTLFFNAHAPQERYSAADTIRNQSNVYLTTNSQLYSNVGNILLTIIADTCGRHDTLGGACAAESNTVRYALEKFPMHSCRDNFLYALATEPIFNQLGMNKRDLPSNINFFMNVPVTESGDLTFSDGVSAPGKYVEMRAEMDVLVLISNCPQLNNPCNAYNPTPIRLLVWDSPCA
ncbi:MAG TPA: urea carboxylase-associated family protein [Nitrosomonas sp.]|nr:urea carboxylase-associated family protein [Nitrosomonas sp.]HMW21454.1 urea carboxylase-associated family protein [Nitrosomonas sp.]HMW69617.1 urea carboxylase-associated family protein [Nitrosomonas sp.]HMY90939.1 urea carboxylase-associated family protein [Nitrosomonas sp.]HNB01070.1 urea carboxylase-associated family protein [Nitrosomonas sp.]